jgi:hypothetical protein
VDGSLFFPLCCCCDIIVASPAGFTINFDGEPAPQARAMGAGYVIGIPPLNANATATLLIGLQCASPAAAVTSEIRAQAVLPGVPVLPFNVPLYTGDVLRPLNLNTQQYGQYWKQLANEGKVTVSHHSLISNVPLNDGYDVG